MTDVRERLARFLAAKAIAASDNGGRLPDNLWAQKLPLADAILAAFPQIASPTQDAVEAAREIVAVSEFICGPCGAPLPNPDCGHAKNGVVGCCVPSPDQPLVDRIAAAITAAEARVREECAKIAEASSLHPPYTADGAQASIAAAIRRRTP